MLKLLLQDAYGGAYGSGKYAPGIDWESAGYQHPTTSSPRVFVCESPPPATSPRPRTPPYVPSSAARTHLPFNTSSAAAGSHEAGAGDSVEAGGIHAVPAPEPAPKHPQAAARPSVTFEDEPAGQAGQLQRASPELSFRDQPRQRSARQSSTGSRDQHAERTSTTGLTSGKSTHAPEGHVADARTSVTGLASADARTSTSGLAAQNPQEAGVQPEEGAAPASRLSRREHSSKPLSWQTEARKLAPHHLASSTESSAADVREADLQSPSEDERTERPTDEVLNDAPHFRHTKGHTSKQHHHSRPAAARQLPQGAASRRGSKRAVAAPVSEDSGWAEEAEAVRHRGEAAGGSGGGQLSSASLAELERLVEVQHRQVRAASACVASAASSVS